MEKHILEIRKRICIDEEAQKNKCQEKAMLTLVGDIWSWRRSDMRMSGGS